MSELISTLMLVGVGLIATLQAAFIALPSRRKASDRDACAFDHRVRW